MSTIVVTFNNGVATQREFHGCTATVVDDASSAGDPRALVVTTNADPGIERARFQPGAWLYYEVVEDTPDDPITEEDVADYASRLCWAVLGRDIGSDDVTAAQRTLIAGCAREALNDGASL